MLPPLCCVFLFYAVRVACEVQQQQAYGILHPGGCKPLWGTSPALSVLFRALAACLGSVTDPLDSGSGAGWCWACCPGSAEPQHRGARVRPASAWEQRAEPMWAKKPRFRLSRSTLSTED